MQPFARQQRGRLGQHVKRFARFVDGVARPLRAFAVGAVHIGVAHREVERAERFFPEFVVQRVRALEFAGKLRVVARLTELQLDGFGPFGQHVIDLVPVRPTQVLVALKTFAGDVFAAQVVVAAVVDEVVVRHDLHRVAGMRLQLDVRCDLSVIGQRADDRVAAASLRGVVAQLADLPQRDRALDQLVPRPASGRSVVDRPGHVAVVERRHVPCVVAFAPVVADVRLGQAEVGVRLVAGSVGGVRLALPSLVAQNVEIGRLAVEDQAGLAAVVVRERRLAEIPQQHGDRVLPLDQVRSQLHLVVVGILRIGASFETSLEYDQPAVHPKPVLAVRSDAGDDRGGQGGQIGRIAVVEPCIGLFGRRARAEPAGFPWPLRAVGQRCDRTVRAPQQGAQAKDRQKRFEFHTAIRVW